MKQTKHYFRWLLISQHFILFGSSMVFPYYVIFIKNIGANFTEFGFAYGLFLVSSAVIHRLAGQLIDRLGSIAFLVISAWGMAFTLVFFPIVTNILQVYAIQIIMGMFNALQKTAEKTMLAHVTTDEKRGQQIGRYHAWTTLSSGVAVIAAGYTIDLFGIAILFYIGSFCMFLSGLAALKMRHNI